MKMTSTSAGSEDGDYIEKGSFTGSCTSIDDDSLGNNNEWGGNGHNTGLKELNSEIKIQDEYSLMEKINHSGRIDNEEIEDYLSDQNEVNVNLIVGHDSINLRLNEEMAVQEVIDIVGDMFGLIENSLGLAMNEELVETNTKLKSLAENKNIEMKVVVCIDDEVTSIVVDNLDHTDLIERNIKQCQNVSVQTNSRIKLCSRETQTPQFPLRDSATNTPHTKSVQADASVGPKDTILQIKEYVPYDDVVKYHNAQAVMIQKCIRRFLAQKRIIKMKKERDLTLMKKKLQKEEFSFEKLQDSIKQIMNKRPVLLHDDFSKAYALVMKWVKEEKINIIEEKSCKDKKVALRNLFNKEMECLRYIQKCRMEKKNENEEKMKFRILDKASKSPLNLTIQGNKSTNQNENVFKASLFKSFYKDLKRRDLEMNERINCLNDLNDFLSGLNAPDCTQEMVALIEREIQMISLGVKKSSLEGSRKRLEELFLYLSTDPEFNPSSSKEKETLSETLFRCKTCKELKPPEKFNIDLLKGLTHCTVCTLRKELAHSCVALTPYKHMIQEIYKDEMKKGSEEGYISLLQPSGLYYLVQRIWQGRSCLSEENDMDLLRFIRWNKHYPWSPWNCILLTGNEAELHLSIENIDSFYGVHFLKKIENKHLQAKTKFSDLEELNDRIKTSYCRRINPGAKSITLQEPLLIHSIINKKTKKLEPNCILKEPISDLVYARCNYF